MTLAVIVLAAGEGTRMKSRRLPKVLHGFAGRSMLGHVLAAARPLDAAATLVVVGHGRDRVIAELTSIAPAATPVVQDEQRGTGHAVARALAALPADDADMVLVVPGDAPLLTPETLAGLVAAHEREHAAATTLTSVLDDPSGYGRVLRGADGTVERVVEHKDATPEELEVRESAVSVYTFDAGLLRKALERVGTDNAQGEQYLPDVVGILVADGERVAAVTAPGEETAGVNDRVQLAAVRAELNRRVLERWMLAGVTVVDPATTWVDVQVRLGRDVVVEPGTQLRGQTTVGDAAVVGPDTTLTDVEIGEGATVVRTHGSSSWIGPGASVGPFAYLRPGARLGADGKIGTFVEVKNAEIGRGSKVPHLTYVGDATIGEQSNIGASSVFVNYDGVGKHRTTIGSHVRTGSDTMFIAPVTVGDGAYTGAGTVVREDVPPGALAVSSGPQRTIDGWVVRKRPGSPAAEAAERASDTAARGAAESGRGGTAQ
jgi:bifunctional UDP-N-acetylglucosamine pyrophosphorylase/glucosamine-1-phosphate N-acetyltransferase